MKSLNTASKSLAILSLLVLITSVAGMARAADPDIEWEKNHPRRAQLKPVQQQAKPVAKAHQRAVKPKAATVSEKTSK